MLHNKYGDKTPLLWSGIQLVSSPLQNVWDVSAAKEILAHSHHTLTPFAGPSPKSSQNAHQFLREARVAVVMVAVA